MPDVAYVNDRFLPLAEATVSIDDRGFLFGDGIYEVIRTYHGTPFQLDAHLARLKRSADALSLTLPRSLEEVARLVDEALGRGGWPESKIYMQITRGVAPRDHVFPAGVRPTFVMTVRELRPLDPALRTRGVAGVTMDDLRWGRCDIKSVNLLANVLARQRANEAGAFEALFVREGAVTEGSVSNVLIVRDGVIATTPEGHAILSGVTRQVVLELARKAGIAVQERRVPLDELRQADEIVLMGTTVEVLPVVTLDSRPVGTGRPGPIAARLHASFTEFAA
ncbi:MAG TPA: D-amino-acid transaminase [Nitrospirales bacterium]|nr:D-amino-acid transaminase [Nitrospirales bacterium]